MRLGLFELVMYGEGLDDKEELNILFAIDTCEEL